MTASNDSFIDQLRQGFINTGADIANGLVLAVSGGADSVALMHGVLQIWPESRSSILVAHVNHGLRGSESDSDELFVRNLAESMQMKCDVLKLNETYLKLRKNKSIEEAARICRYEFLRQTAKRYSMKHVATAHHADDQAETILHNLIRGTGLRGLRGMAPSRALDEHTELIRPMLSLSRRQVEQFVSRNNFIHQVDSSNCDSAFTRNRLRRNLLPMLRSDFNSGVDRSLISLAEQVQQALSTMDAMASRVLSDATLDCQTHSWRLDRARLVDWPRELVRHALSVMWARQNWPRQKMSFRHYERLAAAIFSSADHREDFPGGVQVNIKSGVVRFGRLGFGLENASKSEGAS